MGIFVVSGDYIVIQCFLSGSKDAAEDIALFLMTFPRFLIIRLFFQPFKYVSFLLLDLEGNEWPTDYEVMIAYDWLRPWYKSK